MQTQKIIAASSLLAVLEQGHTVILFEDYSLQGQPNDERIHLVSELGQEHQRNTYQPLNENGLGNLLNRIDEIRAENCNDEVDVETSDGLFRVYTNSTGIYVERLSDAAEIFMGTLEQNQMTDNDGNTFYPGTPEYYAELRVSYCVNGDNLNFGQLF